MYRRGGEGEVSATRQNGRRVKILPAPKLEEKKKKEVLILTLRKIRLGLGSKKDEVRRNNNT